MKRWLWVFVIIGILGITHASLTCVGDNSPNLRSVLYLSCQAGMPSTCWAVVTDNLSNVVGFAPGTAFGIDRELWYSDNNGTFIASISVNDGQYGIGHDYTAIINCVGNDSSSLSTTHDFAPGTYASPDWVAYWWIWIKNNLGAIGAGLLLFVIVVIIGVWVFRKLTG